MEEESKVILHGVWTSPYVKRVELALKLKGIPFEYVEEDLINKSPLLLKYNPVHKKVPVHVHNVKPIAESHVILEYIDETWKDGHCLLPHDPYNRAQIRFWSGFIQQLFETLLTVFKTEGETQRKAMEELLQKLRTLEDGLKDLFSEDSKFVNGEDLGVLDIVMCSTLGVYKIQEKVLGMKFIDSERNPHLFSWLKAISEHPVVKESTPPYEKSLELLQFVRQKFLNSPAA